MLPVTKTLFIDGAAVSVKRLSLEDLFTVGEQITAAKIKLARELGKEEKLDHYEITNMVIELKSKPTTVAEILARCDAPQGASDVIRFALGKSGIEAARHAEIVRKLAIPEALELARALVLDVQEEAKGEEGKSEESPLPSAATPESAVASTPAPATSEESLKAKAVGYGDGK